MTLLKTLFLIRRLMLFFLMSIKTTVMCLIKRRLMNFCLTANTIIKSSWLMKGFPHKVRFIHCQTINFRKWRNILLKILKKVSLNSVRFSILCQYYLLWKQMKIFNFVLTTKNSILLWNTTVISYYSLMKCLHKF